MLFNVVYVYIFLKGDNADQLGYRSFRKNTLKNTDICNVLEWCSQMLIASASTLNNNLSFVSDR